MRVLIAGASGQTGSELQRTAPASAEVVCLDSRQLDITDRNLVLAIVGELEVN